MEWYAVHTHVNKEVISEKNLIRQNFITYLPKYKKIIRHARKISTVVRPLFPKYLFVKMDLVIATSVSDERSISTFLSITNPSLSMF